MSTGVIVDRTGGLVVDDWYSHMICRIHSILRYVVWWELVIVSYCNRLQLISEWSERGPLN